MQVLSVSSVKLNSCNIIPSSVEATRNKSCNSSFGWLLKPKQAKLIETYLPKERRRLFDGELIDAALHSPDPRKATDNILSRILREAKENRFIERLTKFSTYVGGFINIM